MWVQANLQYEIVKTVFPYSASIARDSYAHSTFSFSHYSIIFKVKSFFFNNSTKLSTSDSKMLRTGHYKQNSSRNKLLLHQI